ncbi:Zn-dependent hydrolase [Cupriavidus sp. CuC1]|uniref:Zn-dependent hydrolase n=1 Tax=Cupriavidus sp. CuC1 TaxID=3373131 RepID=UPI0037D59A99
MMSAIPSINADRLWKRIQTLSLLTLPDQPWTRRAFSPQFVKSRAWLKAEFKAAGLEVRVDAAGNLIGRRAGKRKGLAPLVTGSHCDTVVGGGRFDGIAGVLAGLEVAQALHEADVHLDHPLEVIDFLSEEPSDFGASCVGSRGMCGLLAPAMLSSTNASGETLSSAIASAGGEPTRLRAPLRKFGDMAAFVELHIEQGPVLERMQLPIGVVTNIVGIRRSAIRVTGQPDHAGTTPMHIRKDALVGAAHIITEVFRRASAAARGDSYVVATVGKVGVHPNMSNAVPGCVELTLEVRSDQLAVLQEFPEQVMAAAREELELLQLCAEMHTVSQSTPTDCSELVMDAASRAATDLGYSYTRMPSGAGHDAAYMSHLGPMGMIFIPCFNGRSHCAEEWIEPGQLTDGTRVLCQTLRLLDTRLAENHST